MKRIILPDAIHGMRDAGQPDFDPYQDEKIDLNEKITDGSEYDRLADFYYFGIQNFSYMVALNKPKKFQKSDKRATERHSCEQGILAYEMCIKSLRAQINGTKPIIVSLDFDGATYERLADWYKDALISFVMMTYTKIPKKFQKSDSVKTDVASCRAAIEAFERCIDELKAELR